MRFHDSTNLRPPHQLGQSLITPPQTTRWGGVLFIVVLLAGCTGPSKARYAQLLGECRNANREHLRMLKEYEKLECKSHPEQAAGSVEMGLGGF
jgi:hypothetical protein